MKKHKRIIGLLIFLLPFIGNAQINETEARAAFLLAENFYAKGEMSNALQFIEQAKTNLGGGNCKIYYLEILIRNELYKSNKRQYEELQKVITAFQTSKDFNTFNKEKILEILQLKMLISMENEKQKISDSIQKKTDNFLDENFKRYRIEGWPINISFDQLKVLKKNHPFFKNKLTSIRDLNIDGKKPEVNYYYNEKSVNKFYLKSNGFPFIMSKREMIDSIACIVVMDGLVKYYIKPIEIVTPLRSEFRSLEDAKKMKINKIVTLWSEKFKFTPQLFLHGDRDLTIYQYVWERAKSKFILQFILEKSNNYTTYGFEVQLIYSAD